MSGHQCSIEGCGRPHRARGWCHRHYYRWKRQGDPEIVLGRPPSLDADGVIRWTGWTETLTGCWEWGGTRDEAGYGKVRFYGPRVMAHRLAYEAWIGPIEGDLLVRHSCDNPPCINPAHLLIGTQVDNMRDMEERGRARRRHGEDNGNAKLTYVQVKQIREQRKSGRTLTSLADEFGVSISLIGMIARREAWRSVS